MNTSRLWVEVTIGGIPFSFSLLFLLLGALGVSDFGFLTTLLNLVSIVGLTILSYVIGISLHILLHWLAGQVNSKNAYDADTDVAFLSSGDTQLQKRASFAYGTHVMLRLLCVGIVCLWASIFYWLASTDMKRFQGPITIACLLLFVLFAAAYFAHRPIQMALKEAIQDKNNHSV